jgi:demethylmenaquinone methyltransferase/2-methoxy-6-polyprenyl-1,4-benzoquinol methylase
MTGRNAPALQEIFTSVHRRYRLVNHLLTLGLDRYWRRKAAEEAAKEAGGRWLDICSGTGDMAARLVEAAPAGTGIFAVDFTMPMIKTARSDPRLETVDFVLGDAAKLPFAGDSFDLAAISFSTRNLNLCEEALTADFREFLRVLKPGGVFLNLETSQPGHAALRKIYHFLVRLYVAPAGKLISGAGPAYRYLSGTIPRFYHPEKLSSMMETAGFTGVSFRRLTLGAVAVHRGVKPGPED